MNFEIRDKKLLLDMMQASIDYYYKTKSKDPVIFAKVPSDIIDRNFQGVFKELKIAPRVVDAWLNAFPVGHSSMAGHNHANEVWIYYLNVPKNSGNLILVDQDTEYEPKENDLVVIPKGQNHKVTENKSDGFRISLAVELVIGK